MSSYLLAAEDYLSKVVAQHQATERAKRKR